MVPSDPPSDKRPGRASARALCPRRADQIADQTGRVISPRHLLDHGEREPVAPEPACEVVPRAAAGPEDSEPQPDDLPEKPQHRQADRDTDEDSHDQFQCSSLSRRDLPPKSPMFMFSPLLPRSSRRLRT